MSSSIRVLPPTTGPVSGLHRQIIGCGQNNAVNFIIWSVKYGCIHMIKYQKDSQVILGAAELPVVILNVGHGDCHGRADYR